MPQFKCKEIIPTFKRKEVTGKDFPVKIYTFIAELQFNLEYKATGQDLFDLVCRTIGLRETWYFGLRYVDSKGYIAWLKLDKKVLDQGIPQQTSMTFTFLAKFYPEVTAELIQKVTQHLFYLQVNRAILAMDIFCPPEVSVLLASYAVQAKFGDLDTTAYKPGMIVTEELIPQTVINQYQMTAVMWEERIKTWHAKLQGMPKDVAEIEYLKIAQDLKMYGVNYFPISHKEATDLWLGVTSLGLNIYEKESKTTPITQFHWTKIRYIGFDEKKFTIKPINKSTPNCVFFSHKVRMNRLILDLCIGNHDLFMRRRKPDSIEVQQMRTQAREETFRRQIERYNFVREKQLRKYAEQLLVQSQEEIHLLNEALHRSVATADLLAEKSCVAEEEAMLLGQKTTEAEHRTNQFHLAALRAEEEKASLERKTWEAEQLTARLVDVSERKAAEGNELKKELHRAHVAEELAKNKLLDFISRKTLPDTADTVTDNEMKQLSLEVATQRVQQEKSEQLQKQLNDLKTEIEVLKIGQNAIRTGHVTAEQVTSGSTKTPDAYTEEL